MKKTIKSDNAVFTIITVLELYVAMETNVLNRSTQNRRQHSLTPMLLQTKFECDRPAGLRDMFERVNTRTDGHTHGRQLEYYHMRSPLSVRVKRAKSCFCHYPPRKDNKDSHSQSLFSSPFPECLGLQSRCLQNHRFQIGFIPLS